MARLWSNRTPALIVSRSPTVMASLANADGGDEETAAGMDGIARDGLKRPSVVVDEPRRRSE